MPSRRPGCGTCSPAAEPSARNLPAVDAAVVILVALLGVPVGAFLNVVIDRVPDKAPLRGPRDGEASAPVLWGGLPVQPWLLRRRSSGHGFPARGLWVDVRSEERRVGKACVSACRSSW